MRARATRHCRNYPPPDPTTVPPLTQLTTPDLTTVQHEISSINSFAGESIRDPNFVTAQHIDASSAGLVGKTDNTAVLPHLLGGGNRTIHIPASDYVTGKLEIPANTALLADSGVILQDSGHLGPDDRLLNMVQATNVYIGGSARR